jgi:sigma-B regulation protein RsbU (phosphoserine phosphatase)
MDIADLEYFRNLLTGREESLKELLSSDSCCSQAEADKVRSLLSEIKEALGHVEDGTYGKCRVCDGQIERHRLVVQPATEVCLDCISDQEKTQLEEELSLAGKIHKALLSQEIPDIEGFEVAVTAEISQVVGGDYFDFLSCSNGDRMRIIVADSMGKGLPAGLLMSNLQGALRVLSETTECPSALVTTLNQWICHNIPLTKFISLVCIELQPGTGSDTMVSYTNAGHPPPILVRRDGTIERLEAAGIVLGVHDSGTYERSEFRMDPGELLVLFTDGVTEARNERGEMYEEDRLLKFVQSDNSTSLDVLLADLMSDVLHFTGKRQLDDDFTAVLLRRKES